MNFTTRPDISIKTFSKVAIYALLLSALYYSAFTWLVTEDWAREDFSYGILIPVIVLYLIWEKRAEFLALPSQPSWIGIIPVGLGIIFYWLGELAGEFFSLYLSFWFVVVGLLWMHVGWTKLKSIGFALIIMLTMFPIPNFLYTKVSVNLKLISSQLGVAMMQTYGMSAYREGNVIDLGFTQLQVVDACSGLRYLIPLIVLGILMAYFYKGALWKKGVLVASTIPLSIGTNGLRIAMTGILYEDWGAAVAEGFFHGFSGWFIFMFSVGVLLLEMWILNRIAPQKGAALVAPAAAPFQQEAREIDASRHRRLFSPPQFPAALLLLGLTFALSYGIEFREKIPISKPLSEFPATVGDWTGIHESMEQKFIDELDLTDYTIVDYRNNEGKAVNFYVAYYESQRKGESIHSPATCLPGGGWVYHESGEVSLPAGIMEDNPISVNRAFMQKGGQKQLLYYWFPQRGRILTNAYQLKIYAFWDALTRQRTDGALVRLITPVYELEDLAGAEQRLQGFAQKIVPVLNQFIPN